MANRSLFGAAATVAVASVVAACMLVLVAAGGAPAEAAPPDENPDSRAVAQGSQAGGEVWAWGQNGLGQLGNGTTTDSLTPVRVKNLSGVEDVAAGGGHSLAMK